MQDTPVRNESFNLLPEFPNAYKTRKAASFGFSLFMHFLVILVLIVISPLRAIEIAEQRLVAFVFVPPKAEEMPEKEARPGPELWKPASVAGIKVELSGIKLRICEDTSYELMSVLKRHNGFIGFSTKDSPAYLANIFRATDLQPVDPGILIPRESFFAIRFKEPEKWREITGLCTRNGIESSSNAYALFSFSFGKEIEEAIRQAAEARRMQGRVTEAVIRFSAKIQSGVIIEKVAASL